MPLWLVKFSGQNSACPTPNPPVRPSAEAPRGIAQRDAGAWEAPTGSQRGTGGKSKKPQKYHGKWWLYMALYGFIWLYMALYGTNVPPFYWYWIPSGKTNIAMGNHHFEWENSLFLWPCSIANFVCLPEGTMENDENVYQNPLKTVKLMMFKWSPIFLMGGMERSKIA